MGEIGNIGCQMCHDIFKAFSGDEPRSRISLGSYAEATASKCPAHTPLSQEFHGLGDIGEHDELEIMTGTKDSSVCLLRAARGPYLNLLLVKKEEEGHIGTARILDPEWAEAGISKQWKHRCVELHGAKCDNPMKVPSTRPPWVIDVEKRCLVPGSCRDCDRYVALSYTIEGDEENPGGFKVDDAETLEKLQQPESIDSREISERLPAVIQHAMYLTSTLGERYLWADSICALHGDAVNTNPAAQRDLRGAIYASALVTIISTAKDGRDGIPGLQGISNPRKLKQRIIPFGDEKIAVRNTGIFHMGAWSPYQTRGWTYQAYRMSPRKLMIVGNELHWECQCSVWHEELTLGTEIDQYIDPRLKVILAGFPDIDSLGHAIDRYNDRELSYDEDVLAAISPLLSALSRSFEGGFLYGLPEMLFDRALGWSPFWKFTNLRRRAVSNQSTSGDIHLPSWSWMGWQGMICLGDNEAMRINRRVSDIQETIPITEWYTSKTPTGSPLRRIRPTWFENRDTYKDLARPLPPGWTKHAGPPAVDKYTRARASNEPYLHPEGCGEYHFKHPELTTADNDCDSWYYPFPVPDIQPSRLPVMPEQTPYLHCKTKRATLWARITSERNFNEIDIFNKSGYEVGKLRLHNEKQLKDFPKEATDDGPGKSVELVAIHRSWRRKKIFDEEKKCFATLADAWETYQVLWVEWKEGVAYRLAGGHVEKESWEELDLEEISLVLG